MANDFYANLMEEKHAYWAPLDTGKCHFFVYQHSCLSLFVIQTVIIAAGRKYNLLLLVMETGWELFLPSEQVKWLKHLVSLVRLF